MQTLWDIPVEPKPREREPSEVEKAQQVLDGFEYSRGEYLDMIRAGLRIVWKHRFDEVGHDAYVTADDARAIFEAIPNVPGPKRLSRNFLGQVFRTDEWEWTDQYVKSKTPGLHGNPIKCWRYVG